MPTQSEASVSVLCALLYCAVTSPVCAPEERQLLLGWCWAHPNPNPNPNPNPTPTPTPNLTRCWAHTHFPPLLHALHSLFVGRVTLRPKQRLAIAVGAHALVSRLTPASGDGDAVPAEHAYRALPGLFARALEQVTLTLTPTPTLTPTLTLSLTPTLPLPLPLPLTSSRACVRRPRASPCRTCGRTSRASPRPPRTAAAYASSSPCASRAAAVARSTRARACGTPCAAASRTRRPSGRTTSCLLRTSRRCCRATSARAPPLTLPPTPYPYPYP